MIINTGWVNIFYNRFGHLCIAQPLLSISTPILIILYKGTTQWNDAEAPSKVYMSALQIGNKIFDRSQVM